MKIGIDIDGVIVNFVKDFCDIVKREYNHDLKEEEIFCHDLNIVLGISQEEAIKLIEECINRKNLEMINGAKESIQKLYKNHEIYLITGRPKRFEKTTEVWLYDKGIPYHKLYVLGYKDKNNFDEKLDILIDDNLETLFGYVDKVKYLLLFDHPWNRLTLNINKLFIRVHDWNEVLTIVRFCETIE